MTYLFSLAIRVSVLHLRKLGKVKHSARGFRIVSGEARAHVCVYRLARRSAHHHFPQAAPHPAVSVRHAHGCQGAG